MNFRIDAIDIYQYLDFLEIDFVCAEYPVTLEMDLFGEEYPRMDGAKCTYTKKSTLELGHDLPFVFNQYPDKPRLPDLEVNMPVTSGSEY